MTIAAEPIVGSTRIIVLAPPVGAVKGKAAEFRRSGFTVDVRGDVVSALTELLRDPSALLIVSSELAADGSSDALRLGLATCGSSVMLGMTSATTAAAVSAALAAGARGTVDLPLTPDRLARALRALPPRVPEAGPLHVGELTIDPARHRVTWSGVEIQATPREFALLLDLARHHPGVVDLDDLARRHSGGTNDPRGTVRVIVTHVRARLMEGAGPGAAAIIETVRGIGYRLAG